MAQKRSSLWEVIVYPGDSLPPFYKDIIEQTQVPCALSPVHNADRYTLLDESEDKTHVAGAIKKPHQHLIIDFGSGANKTMEQVQELFCVPLNAKAVPSIVHNSRGAVRYLIHLDHPDKAQYRLDEIRYFNGFDCKDYFDLSSKEIDEMCLTICDYIEDNDIVEYADLVVASHSYMPWFNYVKNHSIFFTSYLKSRKYKQKEFLSAVKEQKTLEDIQKYLKKADERNAIEHDE